MSYAYDEDDNADQSGSGLRAQLEKALADLKAAQKTNTELNAKFNETRLSQIFADKKVPANIQRWMKRDEVEPSPEAVDKWLAENGEDFGYKPGATPAAVTESPEGQQSPVEEAPAAPAVESVLTPEDVAQLTRIQGLLAQGVGQTVLSDATSVAVSTVESQLGDNASFEEAVAALQAQGIDMDRAR